MEGKTKEVVEVVYDKVAYESWCVTKKNGVCVWTICTDVKLPSVCFVFWSTIFLPYMQGGSESHSIHCPTKTVV
jgi:hypothetical protein